MAWRPGTGSSPRPPTFLSIDELFLGGQAGACPLVDVRKPMGFPARFSTMQPHAWFLGQVPGPWTSEGCASPVLFSASARTKKACWPPPSKKKFHSLAGVFFEPKAHRSRHLRKSVRA